MCVLRFLMQARVTMNRFPLQYLFEVPASSNTSGRAINLAESTRKLYLVIGNESCDLDSAVSAVTLALIYSHRLKEHDFVPVLNIPRIDYPLKTEVSFMFNRWEIKEDMLVFRDDLPARFSGTNIKVILVDHHVNNLAPYVCEIFDHRPVENNPMMDLLPENCLRNIDPEVGSCATLVGERYLSQAELRSASVEKLLRATIILDTINFSPNAKRFCARDLEVVEKLERLLQPCENIDENEIQRRRTEIFDELVAARADISQLSLAEVLRKDMKRVQTSRYNIPMAGLPMLARDFIELSGAQQAICQFGAGANLIVLLGMYVQPYGDQVIRDVAIIAPTGDINLLERVRQALSDCVTPMLDLRQHAQETNFMGGCYLRQHNIEATRKHILPVIKNVLVDLESSQQYDSDDVYFFKEKPKLGL